MKTNTKSILIKRVTSVIFEHGPTKLKSQAIV